MAIITMTGIEDAALPNVRILSDYPGHEAGSVRHDRGCPHYSPGIMDRSGKVSGDCPRNENGYCACWVSGPLYMKTTHEGLVLALGEHNYYDDSDFYAVVWNPEKRCAEEVGYASTRGWTYPNNAVVDASPDVMSAYVEWKRAQRAEQIRLQELREAATARVGKTVKVVRGRKVPQGTIGRVFWVGADNFRRRYDGFCSDVPERLGLELPSGARVFTAAANVEVIAVQASA